jgi:hypothetical protein
VSPNGCAVTVELEIEDKDIGTGQKTPASLPIPPPLPELLPIVPAIAEAIPTSLLGSHMASVVSLFAWLTSASFLFAISNNNDSSYRKSFLNKQKVCWLNQDPVQPARFTGLP